MLCIFDCLTDVITASRLSLCRRLVRILHIVSVFVYKDMAVPEPGETQQSVCEAVGGPTEADMHVSDQEDIRLLLQVQTMKTNNKLTFLA